MWGRWQQSQELQFTSQRQRSWKSTVQSCSDDNTVGIDLTAPQKKAAPEQNLALSPAPLHCCGSAHTVNLYVHGLINKSQSIHYLLQWHRQYIYYMVIYFVYKLWPLNSWGYQHSRELKHKNRKRKTQKAWVCKEGDEMSRKVWAMAQQVKNLLCSLSLSSDPSPHTEVSHSGSIHIPWLQIPAPTLAPSAIPARAGGKQAHAGGLLCPV